MKGQKNLKKDNIGELKKALLHIKGTEGIELGKIHSSLYFPIETTKEEVKDGIAILRMEASQKQTTNKNATCVGLNGALYMVNTQYGNMIDFIEILSIVLNKTTDDVSALYPILDGLKCYLLHDNYIEMQLTK